MSETTTTPLAEALAFAKRLASEARVYGRVTVSSDTGSWLESVLESARAADAGRWIPTSERLPDEGGAIYLAYDGEDFYFAGWERSHRDGPRYWTDATTGGIMPGSANQLTGVTHWMRLTPPAAPSEGDNE